MSDQVPKEEQAGILGTLAGWGEAIYTYAADSVSGYVDASCANKSRVSLHSMELPAQSDD